MSPLLKQAARGRVVVALALCYLLGQAGMMWTVQDLGEGLLHLQITTSWTDFQALQADWSPEQWRQYRLHFYPDFVFPWVYGAFLFCWLLNLSANASPRWRLLWPIPALSTLADLIENTLHIVVMNGSPSPEALVFVSGWISRFKWTTALGLALLLATVSSLRLIASKRPRQLA
jgi:hypothetical protein